MKIEMKALAVACLFALNVNANAADIDLFSDGAQSFTQSSDVDNDGGSSTASGDPVGGQTAGGPFASILGGYRDIWVDTYTDPVGGGATIEVKPASLDGVLAFSVSTGAAATGQVQWDGDDAGGSVLAIDEVGLRDGGLTGIDLTADGSNAFQALIHEADHNFYFVLEAYTDATNWTKIELLSHQYTFSLTPVPTTPIPFSAFSICDGSGDSFGITITCGGTGADLTNLGAFALTFGDIVGSTSLDLTLDKIYAFDVPEPATLGLLGMGLLGAGFAGRRRKTTTA